MLMSLLFVIVGFVVLSNIGAAWAFSKRLGLRKRQLGVSGEARRESGV